MPGKKFIPACLIFLGLASQIQAQETLSSVQREMQRVEKDTQREKELHKVERKRAADFESQKAGKVQAMQEQLGFTQGKIDSLKKQLNRSRSQKNLFKNQIALFDKKQKEFVQALAIQCRQLADHFRVDFPYQKEKRTAEMENLAEALEKGTAGLDEGLNRFFAVLDEALEFGYSSEVYTGHYRAVDGTGHEGTYLRLGAVILAFSSQDGKTVAILSRQDSTYAWKDAELSAGIRQSILQAMKVAEGKSPPELVPLPVSVPAAMEVRK